MRLLKCKVQHKDPPERGEVGELKRLERKPRTWCEGRPGVRLGFTPTRALYLLPYKDSVTQKHSLHVYGSLRSLFSSSFPFKKNSLRFII